MLSSVLRSNIAVQTSILITRAFVAIRQLIIDTPANKVQELQHELKELKEYIEDTRIKVCHWFVVEDLDQLKKGGRISAVSATFGKALQIKPLLSVDDEGHLINVAKIRGKSNVVPALVKHLERDAENLKDSVVMVAHADNPEGAEELKKAIKGKCKEVVMTDIGPVIGTHVGSGMLAVLFLGTRNLKS